jgi:NAD(P)-dependent dehydrogenase (short-subunit alcohol dehydrogenase family)
MRDVPPSVLVLGGTGMLRPAVHALLRDGVRVVVVARRPDHAIPEDRLPGDLVPVRADWRDPGAFVDAIVNEAGPRPFAQAILWIHAPHREALISELDRVIDVAATVVRVWGSSTADPRDVLAREGPILPGRSVRDVLLGYAVTEGCARWLHDEEISAGALRALREDRSPQTVGTIDPWDGRP